MNRALVSEILRLGGDPSDDVWVWFTTRGPHGLSFTWGQTRSTTAGYIGVEHLEKIVGELDVTIPAFRERALQVINAAIGSEMPEFVRRAVQVAAVVGGRSELQQVKRLFLSPDPAVASDAKACAFYLKGLS